MNLPKNIQFGIATALCATWFGLASTPAAALVLDDFDAPGISVDVIELRVPGGPFVRNTLGTVAGVAAQPRDVSVLLASDRRFDGALVTMGGGSTTAASNRGQLEYVLSYGAFARPPGFPGGGGPNLGLNLTGLDDFLAEFSSVDRVVNLNVTLYTSAPRLGSDGINPLFYLSSGINIAPATLGGAVNAHLLLNSFNSIAAPEAAFFNFAQVDGVQFLIDRSNDTNIATGNRYTLDRLSFIPTAVPEPAEYALMLVGLAGVAGVARRRRG